MDEVFDTSRWLPEHWNNPFCRALGPAPSFDELYQQLYQEPDHSAADRLRMPHLRRQCVLRLFGAMLPMERQVDVAERVHQMIRLGYQHRNPADGNYRQSYLSSASAVRAMQEGQSLDRAQQLIFHNPDIVAPGFTLMGAAGMGKTRCVNRTLASLVKPVIPEIEEHVVQLPALKVECPSRGGRIQLCIAVAAALDKALSTNYSVEFLRQGIRGDYAMLRLQHFLNLHAVGVLVIDELQHLIQSAEGVRPTMNFLVTLVNLLGIPVMLIGTNEAQSVIQGSFREARRAAGLGQPNWNPLLKDEDWDVWIESLWGFQYTAVPTDLTPELSAVLHDESQGIVDIAVKLFALSQMRAITRGEVLGLPEVITPELLRQVASDEFQSVAPMIVALRNGDRSVLRNYPDLTPLHVHVEEALARSLGTNASSVQRILAAQELLDEKNTKERDDPTNNVRVLLIVDGHDPMLVDAALAEASELVGDGDWLGLAVKARELLTSGSMTSAITKPAPAAKKRKTGRKSPAPGSLVALADGSDDPHAALLAAGIVAEPKEILAA